MYKRQPGEFKAFNGGVLTAAANGLLGPDAAEDANALLSTVGRVNDEAAIVFSGGYKPNEIQIREGRDAIAAAAGPRGHLGQMKAQKMLIKQRLEALTGSMPALGGKRNPYLMEFSPLDGWSEEESKALPAAPASAPQGPQRSPQSEADTKRLEAKLFSALSGPKNKNSSAGVKAILTEALAKGFSPDSIAAIQQRVIGRLPGGSR